MKDIYGKCGFNCGACPSYKDNLITDEDRQRCSDGWHKYFGFRITPAKLRRCDGCQTPDEQDPVLYLSCRARKCALHNGAITCAQCTAYPCEELRAVAGHVGSRVEMEAASGEPIPQEDYLTFLEPFAGLKHLDKIRASLTEKDLVPVRMVSLRSRVEDLPDDLPLSPAEQAAYMSLHRVLKELNTIADVSFARKDALNKRRQYLLRLLWSFGLHGELIQGDGSRLHLDAKTYLEQKLLSYPLDKIKEYIAAGEDMGFRCELISDSTKQWTTPKGGLRPEGWYLTLSFTQPAGGGDTLKVLQRFAAALEGKMGKDAYKTFVKADIGSSL